MTTGSSETRHGNFGEFSYIAKLEDIKPGEIVGGMRMELGYRGVAIVFPDMKRGGEEFAPYASWQIPLRARDLINGRLKVVFPDGVPQQVLEGATRIIDELNSLPNLLLR